MKRLLLLIVLLAAILTASTGPGTATALVGPTCGENGGGNASALTIDYYLGPPSVQWTIGFVPNCGAGTTLWLYIQSSSTQNGTYLNITRIIYTANSHDTSGLLEQTYANTPVCASNKWYRIHAEWYNGSNSGVKTVGGLIIPLDCNP